MLSSKTPNRCVPRHSAHLSASNPSDNVFRFCIRIDLCSLISLGAQIAASWSIMPREMFGLGSLNTKDRGSVSVTVSGLLALNVSAYQDKMQRCRVRRFNSTFDGLRPSPSQRRPPTHRKHDLKQFASYNSWLHLTTSYS